MENRNYIKVITAVFSIIFVVHILRVLGGWEVNIAGWLAPMWVSWLGIMVAGYLAFMGFKLIKK